MWCSGLADMGGWVGCVSVHSSYSPGFLVKRSWQLAMQPQAPEGEGGNPPVINSWASWNAAGPSVTRYFSSCGKPAPCTNADCALPARGMCGAAAMCTAIPTSSSVGGVDATHSVTSARLKLITRASPDDCLRFQRCRITQGHHGQYRNVSHRDQRWLSVPEISTRRLPRMTIGLRMIVAPPRRTMAWVTEPNLERDDEGGCDLIGKSGISGEDQTGMGLLISGG